MKYALLIYENEQVYGSGKDSPLLREVVGRHIAFGEEHKGAIIGGAGLKNTDTATTVRTRDGEKLLHDGPFAETKEQLGGFYLIDVPDLDAAIAMARKMPLPGDGAVEIRPFLSGD